MDFAGAVMRDCNLHARVALVAGPARSICSGRKEGLMAKSEKHNARQVVAMMIHTDNIESEIEAGSSYLDCLRGSNLRRTEIACVTFAGQVLSGSQFAYSGTYFFEQAGMSAYDSYKLALGGTAIAFIGAVLSWFLMKASGGAQCTSAGWR